MRLPIVGAIARKELLESFRDRKTLFLMVFLPVLLYPLLFMVLGQVVSVQQQNLVSSQSRVGISAEFSDHPFVLMLSEDDDIDVQLLEREDSEGSGATVPSLDLLVGLDQWPVPLSPARPGTLDIHFRS
ncbi:MAG: hypothetical protein KC561_13170, partial [Myxococcales bacterium]|nr:hypothetical protein [Myxococcales bacterium]